MRARATTSMEGIQATFANMSRIKSDYVSYNGANLKAVKFHRAELSLCQFDGANLNAAELHQAVLIASSFTNATITQADFTGCLLLLATYDEGNKVTREWLEINGAKNFDSAITDIESLNELIESSKIEAETVKYYMEKINSIFGLLYSMKGRKDNSFFINPQHLALLKYSTQENLDVLKEAYIKLDNYLLGKNFASLKISTSKP